MTSSREPKPLAVFTGDISGFHMMVGQTDFHPEYAEDMLAHATSERLSKGMGGLTKVMRAAMLLEGVDLSGSGGRLSMMHVDETVDQTLGAFERALDRLNRWDVL